MNWREFQSQRIDAQLAEWNRSGRPLPPDWTATGKIAPRAVQTPRDRYGMKGVPGPNSPQLQQTITPKRREGNG